MKTKLFYYFIAAFVSVAMLMSCSKDSSIMPSGEKEKSDVVSSRQISMGMVVGSFSPVPLYAKVMLAQNEMPPIIIEAKDGRFVFENLAPGYYYMMVEYLPAISNSDVLKHYKMGGILVSNWKTTDLGVIYLPE